MKTCIVIPCCKPKLSHPAPAQDLYLSHVFKRCKRIAVECEVDWYIFSAKYGLITPETVIEPYELTLWHNNTMKHNFKTKGIELPPLADPKKVLALKEEANKTLGQYDRRIYLMSRKYCEHLIEGEQPLFNMVFIKQQGFLAKATRETFGL